MRQTTYDYVIKRSIFQGIVPTDLNLVREPNDENPAVWEIFVTYDGKDDELMFLGRTIYEVNITDWIAENVATEATIEGTIEGRDVPWKVAVYPFGSDSDTSAVYEVTSAAYGLVTCGWGTGGDPGNPMCTEPVSGHDDLCTHHRSVVYHLAKES
jgi:hypothetical protein